MSNSFSEVLNIKNFLKQQFIIISSEWVEACISFLKQEHGSNISQQSLKNFVYQQWLNADLEEIGAASLPLDLATTQKTTLKGCFALQVDGIRDVGRPAYAQLKELEQDANSNAEFSAAPDAVLPPWEAKPTRMLMLNLTDGCSRVQGMEYKSINHLSPNLPPGVKVLIQGPVDCRFGVVLLSSEKIRVLGGEVESKITPLSRKALLREILQIPNDDNPDANSADITNAHTDVINPVLQSQDSHITDVSSAFENSRSRQQNFNHVAPQTRFAQRSNSVGGTSTPGNSRMHVQQIRIIQTSSFGRHQRGSSQNQSEVVDALDVFETEEDDFDQNLDFGALDEIERETLSKSQTTEAAEELNEIWLDDEDMVQDMMAFQDENPGFEIPFDIPEEPCSKKQSSVKGLQDKPFTYLCSALKNPPSNSVVTIKAFIITVLSKLECTVDKGWNLMVKINDGTATVDVNIHDKVLEGIIGISAQSMVKMQLEAADNPEKRREVMEAISKCKVTLQDCNCLMDLKFIPGCKPSLVKCYPMSYLHTQQLLQRVQYHS